MVDHKIAGKSKIAMLASVVKAFKCKDIHDLLEANQLLSFIFDEWFRLNERYKKNLYQNNRISKKHYATYEAEAQMLIGLAAFLNEKNIDFVSNSKLSD